MPALTPARPPSRRRLPLRIVVPSRNDPFLRRYTEMLGGPLGRHTAPGIVSPGFFTVERVLIIMTTLAALLSVLVKTPCRAGGWTQPDYFYQACYSDWPVLFASRHLAEGVFPLLNPDSFFEYPALLGLLAGATAWLVPGRGDTGERALAYFDINAALAAAAWMVTVLATARMGHRRPWDAAMVALAPGIVLAGTINWDLWAAMLTALGMLAFARNRPVAAGVYLGLGTALKAYPLLVFGAIILLAVRTGRYRAPGLAAGSAAAAWLLVNVPVLLLNPAGWGQFLAYSRDRGAGYSSIWYAWNLSADGRLLPQLDATFINVASLLLFLAACAGIALLALTAPRRPRLASLAFLVVAAFVLTNKVYSPQFVLWLVPLAALAYPRWRDFLIWQFFEVMHWWAIWMYLGRSTSDGVPEHNLDTPYYVLAVLGHIAATAWLMARVVRSVRHPERDVVRRLDIDDPQGGPFDGAPDRFVLAGPAPRHMLRRPLRKEAQA
ncbi:glycosyltransferase family 87 protein [Arthrobacter sp. GCM10027362]|uniref:glycosyltransferase family 87 protein n=1 Tax=Arthrobacter sp. GCM10027362 TaxID=3273379 RepID=UPI003628AE8C